MSAKTKDWIQRHDADVMVIVEHHQGTEKEVALQNFIRFCGRIGFVRQRTTVAEEELKVD